MGMKDTHELSRARAAVRESLEAIAAAWNRAVAFASEAGLRPRPMIDEAERFGFTVPYIELSFDEPEPVRGTPRRDRRAIRVNGDDWDRMDQPEFVRPRTDELPDGFRRSFAVVHEHSPGAMRVIVDNSVPSGSFVFCEDPV